MQLKSGLWERSAIAWMRLTLLGRKWIFHIVHQWAVWENGHPKIETNPAPKSNVEYGGFTLKLLDLFSSEVCYELHAGCFKFLGRCWNQMVANRGNTECGMQRLESTL
jgi:hypothetical protein